jgi:hypothetical protein
MPNENYNDPFTFSPSNPFGLFNPASPLYIHKNKNDESLEVSREEKISKCKKLFLHEPKKLEKCISEIDQAKAPKYVTKK